MFDQHPDTLEPPTKVFVDQKHLDLGKKCNSRKCAISLSIEDAGGENVIVYFDGQIQFRFKGESYGCPTTYEIKKKILAFDKGRTLDPFMLELNPVKKSKG